MNVIEAARALGKALQEDPRYEAYHAAKLENDKDEELQQKIRDFNMKKMDLNAEMSRDNKDTKKITELDNELNALYTAVVSNKHMAAFEAAREDMDAILASINYIVTCAANGDDPMTCPETAPASCGGSCSTCGGCH